MTTTCASVIRALAQGEQNAAPQVVLPVRADASIDGLESLDHQLESGPIATGLSGQHEVAIPAAAALDREGWVRVPREHFSKFVDVHRSWCNYCFGSESTCMNAPAGGCSLRDAIVAAAPKRTDMDTEVPVITPAGRLISYEAYEKLERSLAEVTRERDVFAEVAAGKCVIQKVIDVLGLEAERGSPRSAIGGEPAQRPGVIGVAPSVSDDRAGTSIPADAASCREPKGCVAPEMCEELGRCTSMKAPPATAHKRITYAELIA